MLKRTWNRRLIIISMAVRFPSSSRQLREEPCCFTKTRLALIWSRAAVLPIFPWLQKPRGVFPRLFVHVTRRSKASRYVSPHLKHHWGGCFLNVIECHAWANSARPIRSTFPFTELLFFFRLGLAEAGEDSVCHGSISINKSRRSGREKFKIPSIKKIVVLLHSSHWRWTNHFLFALVLPFSPCLSLSFSLLSCCLSNVVISQVPCRSRTARRLTRGSTSAWRLTWKACATRPPLTFMCEVGRNPSPEPGQNE